MEAKKLIFITVLFLISNSLYALELNGTFYQGNMILGKTEKNSKVFIDKNEVKVSDEGFFVFGLSKNRKNDIVIEAVRDGTSEKIIKKVFKKKYIIQKINGLPKNQVTPPKEVYERIKKDNNLIAKARRVDSSLTFFTKKFAVPLKNSIITGVYGSQRILNGIPKWPHYGLDFAQKKGAPIKAMNHGIVTLAEEDLFYTGATLIFDHGHGISTLYMHMDKIFVNKGDDIKKGDIVGTIGTSGRSTGPHLDIRLNWFGTRLDPATILDVK